MLFVLFISLLYFWFEYSFIKSGINNIEAGMGIVLGIILLIISLVSSDVLMKLLFVIVALPLMVINIIAIVKNMWNNNSER